MTWRNKLIWILIGLCFIAMVWLSYSYGTSKPSQKILDSFVQKYESIIAEKDSLITEKETALRESEDRYITLVEKIKKKALQAQTMKNTMGKSGLSDSLCSRCKDAFKEV